MRLVLLGLPPTTNNLYAIVRGHQVLTEAGREYHRAVALVAHAALGDRAASSAPFAIMVTYHLGAYDRDVDGSHKTILDGFSPRLKDGSREPIVWQDDRQVVLFVARKMKAPRGVLPYVSIVVRELATPPAYRPPVLRGRALGFATSIIPPSTNNAYTHYRGVRRKTKDARQATIDYAAGWDDLADGARPMFAGPVRITLRFGFRADRRDVDGSHKLLLDAARGIMWFDDRAIQRFSVSKARVAAGSEPVIEGSLWGLVTER